MEDMMEDMMEMFSVEPKEDAPLCQKDLLIAIFEKLCKIESKLEEYEDKDEHTSFNPMGSSLMLEGEY